MTSIMGLPPSLIQHGAERGSIPHSRVNESDMNVPANRVWAPNGSDVFRVDPLARRYARVLLSRRALRALAAGTVAAGQ